MELEVRLYQWDRNVERLRACQRRLVGVTEELDRLERQILSAGIPELQEAAHRISSQKQSLQQRILSLGNFAQALERIGKIYTEKEELVLDCMERGTVPGEWTTGQDGTGGMTALYLPEGAGVPALCTVEEHILPKIESQVQQGIVLKGQ